MQRIHHHWLWAVRVIAGCCLLIFPHQLTAQTCQVTCAVHLIQRDANTVNLVLIGPEVRRNSIAAHTASFDHLCPGNYRLRISGIGIQPVDTAFALQQSTELTIELMASVEQLQLFEVHDDRSDRTGNATLSSSTLSAADLQVNAGKPLGELLKEASGVNSLQSGPTISKPIIHGLHSNRVLIINNGVRLEGQQWGSEHAPEIDPFSVARALVLKGAASLRYGSDAIGGVVLLEPHELAAEKGTRTQLVTRLYSALAHKAESELAYAGEVTDWVPQDPKADTPKSKAEAKPDPRYEKGNFVFFVTVRNPETGRYHVVQGNVFDQAYEQQLLASIAERMDVTIPELSAAVQGLEHSIGFGALVANDVKELQQA